MKFKMLVSSIMAVIFSQLAFAQGQIDLSLEKKRDSRELNFAKYSDASIKGLFAAWGGMHHILDAVGSALLKITYHESPREIKRSIRRGLSIEGVSCSGLRLSANTEDRGNNVYSCVVAVRLENGTRHVAVVVGDPDSTRSPLDPVGLLVEDYTIIIR